MKKLRKIQFNPMFIKKNEIKAVLKDTLNTAEIVILE